METKFKEMFWADMWLSGLFNPKNITGSTVRKAQRGEYIRPDSQFEIYMWLIAKNYIRFEDYTVHELFKEIR